VSLAGPRVVCAMAIIDVGYATSAFAYLYDRAARLLRADLSWLGLPQVSAHVADRAGDGARSSQGSAARADGVKLRRTASSNLLRVSGSRPAAR